jgi:hypothetical protein
MSRFVYYYTTAGRFRSSDSSLEAHFLWNTDLQYGLVAKLELATGHNAGFARVKAEVYIPSLSGWSHNWTLCLTDLQLELL